jgi:hypothetical protein
MYDKGEPNLDPAPVRRPDQWLEHVNRPQTEAEGEALPHTTITAVVTCLFAFFGVKRYDW